MLKRFRLISLYNPVKKCQGCKISFGMMNDFSFLFLCKLTFFRSCCLKTNPPGRHYVEATTKLFSKIAGSSPIILPFLPSETEKAPQFSGCRFCSFFLQHTKKSCRPGGRHENYSSTFSLMCTSSSCFCSTVEGAPIIRSWAFLFMGKVMTSRMLSSPVSSMMSRSTPGAAPA